MSVRIKKLKVAEGMGQAKEEAVNELSTIFEKFAVDQAANRLEQIAFRYSEVDRTVLEGISAYSAGSSVIRRRGRQDNSSLDALTLRALQSCMARFDISSRLEADPPYAESPRLPYLPSQVSFWEGMVYDARRFDAAEWRKRLSQACDRTQTALLIRSRISCFESRPKIQRLGMIDKRAASGMLCAIFEHPGVRQDGITRGAGLYGVVRMLQAHEGHDVYGYRRYRLKSNLLSVSPGLDV